MLDSVESELLGELGFRRTAGRPIYSCAAPREPTPSRPEIHLAAAVVDEALMTVARCAMKPAGRNSRELRDAHRWLSDDRRDWAFSFRNLCDWLGLDAKAVRRFVRRLLDETDESARSML